MKKINVKLKKGFAVLFAVMIASFLITLGISIFSISLKEIQITTSIRDSQVAYYVADSARECALYTDVKLGLFPACLDSSCLDYPTNNVVPVNVTCNGISSLLYFRKDSLNPLNFVSDYNVNFFQVSSTSSSTPVADIQITKKWYNTYSRVATIIEARGHNTGVIGRRVERGISQTNN